WPSSPPPKPTLGRSRPANRRRSTPLNPPDLSLRSSLNRTLRLSLNPRRSLQRRPSLILH
ncbi:MAG TPA: hypothetical protein VGB49_06215, partial [Caulobacteraceae bacterium]